MTTKRKPALDDIIGAATPAERLVSVCVAGALVAEHQQLERELERAQQTEVAQKRLGQKSPAQEVAARIEKLQEQMREQTYTFRFRAISAKAWSDLIAAHPDPSGKRTWNNHTFVPAAITACCVEPEGMDDPERVGKLLDVLSPAQQDDLFMGAFEANTTAPTVPFSYAASAVLRNSVTSSDTASPTGSPAASSSGG